MRAAENSPDGFVYAAVDQLQHDLKTPLTTIYARAYLLGRAIRRAPSLADDERGQMLEGVLAIETAVRAMSAVVETIASPSPDGLAPPPEGDH